VGGRQAGHAIYKGRIAQTPADDRRKGVIKSVTGQVDRNKPEIRSHGPEEARRRQDQDGSCKSRGDPATTTTRQKDDVATVEASGAPTSGLAGCYPSTSHLSGKNAPFVRGWFNHLQKWVSSGRPDRQGYLPQNTDARRLDSAPINKPRPEVFVLSYNIRPGESRKHVLTVTSSNSLR
jgi:hypothetical protein